MDLAADLWSLHRCARIANCSPQLPRGRMQGGRRRGAGSGQVVLKISRNLFVFSKSGCIFRTCCPELTRGSGGFFATCASRFRPNSKERRLDSLCDWTLPVCDPAARSGVYGDGHRCHAGWRGPASGLGYRESCRACRQRREGDGIAIRSGLDGDGRSESAGRRVGVPQRYR